MAMEIFAWAAAALVFASFFRRTMVPLRMLAIASNIAFIGYAVLGASQGLLSKVLPILVLHSALLPLNLIRLIEVRRLLVSVRTMQQGELPYDFLVPFMTAASFQAGAVIFQKGDAADDMYIIKSGQVIIREFGALLGPGALFGEIAIFTQDARRTATAHCETDCELLRIAGHRVLELFYQDKQFSFKVARLLASYA